MARTRRFPVTFFLMLSPFIVWAAHFLVVYGINGLACARGGDARALLGLPAVPVLVTAATVLAVALAAGILIWAMLGNGPAGHVASPAPRRFMRWFTAAGAVCAMVASLWVGLPALIVPACG